MDKVLNSLLQAKVHMLFILGGLALLFLSLVNLKELDDIQMATDLTVARYAAMAIGGLLLVAGVVLYLRPPQDTAAAAGNNAPLDVQGKTIVFTGTLNLERDVLAKQAARLGATTTGQVTSNTDYLVAGTKPGATKIKAAAQHNVTIVSAEQWYATVHKLSR